MKNVHTGRFEMTEENDKDKGANHEEEDKQKDFGLITKAFRTPRGGITERLVCQDLFQGTFTDDKSKKINHLCSAAMCCGDLMKGEDGKKVELPFDPEQIQGIYAVNASFDGAEPFKLDQQGNVLICIPWAFIETEENYHRFIIPWAKGIVPHYYQGQYWRGKTKHMVKLYHRGWSKCDLTLGYCEEGQQEEEIKKILAKYTGDKSCPQCHSRINSVESTTVVMVDDSVLHEFFFSFSKSLTKMSARQYRACFYAWAIPILERAKMAMSNYVSPQTYEDVAKLLSGAKEQNGNSTAARTDKLQD
jgi:hypothetical protein